MTGLPVDPAEFIARSRADFPTMVAAVTAVLDLHQPDWRPGRTAEDVHGKGCAMQGVSFVYYTDCRTVRAVAVALGMNG